MKKTFKSTEQLIEENNSFISAIPNNLGINLCSVKGIEYKRQKDGQLKTLKIIFTPADDYVPMPEESVESLTGNQSTDAYFDQQTRMSCLDMASKIVSQSGFSKNQRELDECVIDVASKMYDFIKKGN